MFAYGEADRGRGEYRSWSKSASGSPDSFAGWSGSESGGGGDSKKSGGFGGEDEAFFFFFFGSPWSLFRIISFCQEIVLNVLLRSNDDDEDSFLIP